MFSKQGQGKNKQVFVFNKEEDLQDDGATYFLIETGEIAYNKEEKESRGSLPLWCRGNVRATKTKFTDSNPAEVDGFSQDVKFLSTSPPGETLSSGSESEISGSLKNP